MKLKIKLMEWAAGIPVAMVNKRTAEDLGVHPKDRILIKTSSKKSKEVSTIIDIIEGIAKNNEIVVSSELKKYLGLKIGQNVKVSLSPQPVSMLYVNKKLGGKHLTEKEINEIIKDIVSNSLSEPEIAIFIHSMDKHGMNLKETISLIKAILKSGNILNLKQKYIADKHCIGGIPGNRTTPLVISICAAGGITMPKSSSRAITSAAGTADVIETIADIEFSMKEVRKIIQKTNACMVWGGSLGMVPADSKIIIVEKILKVDPTAQLLASIMSKKLAMGSEYILIDIPYGKTAKVDKKKALELKRGFEKIGKYFKKKMKIVLTKGDQPIGDGIGPALELIDIINILDPNREGPKDLREKSIYLAGEIFELTGKAKKNKGKDLAEDILNSGQAFKKFKQIIKAQNGDLAKIGSAKFREEIISNKSGKIKEIHNKDINSLAKITGCPADKFSGLYLHSHIGDKIKKGDVIITLHSDHKSRIGEAIKFYNNRKPIKIGN